jgi:hypothetical protein
MDCKLEDSSSLTCDRTLYNSAVLQLNRYLRTARAQMNKQSQGTPHKQTFASVLELTFEELVLSI